MALLAKSALKYQQDRMRVLDMIDGSIEAEHHREVLAGEKTAEAR